MTNLDNQLLYNDRGQKLLLWNAVQCFKGNFHAPSDNYF